MAIREKFYSTYYTTQASRYAGASLKNNLYTSKKILEAEIFGYIPSDKNCRILDLGCGTGSLLLALEEAGYKNVQGIDISSEQINIAEELGLKNIECAEAKEFLNDKKDEYHAVIGIDFIEHFTKEELLDLLNSIKNALKEGGIAIFRTPNADAPMASTYTLGDFTHEVFLNYFSAEQVLLNAGYRNIKVMPSHIRVSGVMKRLFQSIFWPLLVLVCKLVLFSSGKSTKMVVFTPNLLIIAQK